MTSGSSADTTWTFSGGVAAPAVGESTADDTVVQSVDSSTEEDKAKPSSSAAPEVALQSKEFVESINAFTSDILRIKDYQRQRSEE